MSRTPKPIRIEGDVAYVPLTKGYEALIDSEDVHIVDRLSWRAMVRGGIVYAIAADGQKTVYMHRVIMGADRGVFVDHAAYCKASAELHGEFGHTG
jgi:hypothetical protein